jgi:hypothetical protein
MKYETVEDRKRELAAAERWLRNSIYPILDDCELEPQKEFSGHDFVVRYKRDNSIACLLEVKCRNVDHARYGTLVVDKVKRRKILALANELEVPAFAIWHLTGDDVIYYIDIAEEPDKEGTMQDSRDHRGNPIITPVVHWSVERMRYTHDSEQIIKDYWDNMFQPLGVDNGNDTGSEG